MKKVLATLLASAMAISAIGGLVACGGDGGSDANTLVVWCPEAAKAGYESMVADWKTANPDYSGLTVTFTSVDEGEVETKLNTDASKGADVYFFEAGQIAGLQEKNLLQNLGATVTAEIKARDAESWYGPILNAGGSAMAFPATADNGYFLWYDSTVYTEEDVKTLDAMLTKAKAQNKNIMFDFANGWYIPSFWFGAGHTMDYQGDNYVTDINNDSGKEVAKAVNGYLGPTNNKMANGNACIIKQSKDLNSEIGTGFASGTVAAGIIGTWIATDVENKMDGVPDEEDPDKPRTPHEAYTRTDGAKYADIKCTKLPTYTLGGKQVQMGSFMGGKYCGVNAQRKTGNIEAAISLANFFTGEKGQKVRFDTTAAGPTNIKVSNSDDVKENKALAALSAQNNAGGYLQLQQSANFWKSWEAFGNGIYTGTGPEGSKVTLGDTALLEALATLSTSILT